MPEIRPFEGIRYKARDISRLICPPYDIITLKQKNRLLHSNKNNFVSIELPSPTYSFYGKSHLYDNATKKFFSMLQNGITTRDPKSFYLYEQKFRHNGKTFLRTGLIAAVKLENPSTKNKSRHIFPHEKILPKPAAERKYLLSKLRAQTSAVFFISDSPQFPKLLKTARRKSTLLSKAKMDGIIHTLRRIDGNSSLATQLINLFRSQNPHLFIADGHHRYNVAWQYRAQTLKKYKPKNRTQNIPQNYVLGYISPAFDSNLLVLPTHRILTPPQDLLQRISENFLTVSKEKYHKYLSSTACKKCILPQPLIIRYNKKTLYLLPKKNRLKSTLKSFSLIQNLAPRIARDTILKGIPPHHIFYTHSDEEAIKKADKEKKLALLLPPPSIETILKISRSQKTMPQKSTYFYPKVYAGVVTYPLF